MLILYGIYLIYSTFKNSQKTIFIKINENGIQTHNTVFLEWNKIKKINIYRDGFGKNTKYFMKFSYQKKGEFAEEKLNLMSFELNFEEIEDLIKIYKKRYYNNERTNY